MIKAEVPVLAVAMAEYWYDEAVKQGLEMDGQTYATLSASFKNSFVEKLLPGYHDPKAKEDPGFFWQREAAPHAEPIRAYENGLYAQAGIECNGGMLRSVFRQLMRSSSFQLQGYIDETERRQTLSMDFLNLYHITDWVILPATQADCCAMVELLTGTDLVRLALAPFSDPCGRTRFLFSIASGFAG
ncbi:hypothetical protein AK812_SmicGene4035 [Symbiodinium microadriaticum]|uniref:Uncharacterized protein n=1 Tax=Symbiodinium microadriaticum TaxID=2951 RepID=A0A1Q9EXJ6_SYMMI|nr:hypothetical protein AK812_SmicGene4035 [Symbiodinium microadriaticum]